MQSTGTPIYSANLRTFFHLFFVSGSLGQWKFHPVSTSSGISFHIVKLHECQPPPRNSTSRIPSIVVVVVVFEDLATLFHIFEIKRLTPTRFLQKLQHRLRCCCLLSRLGHLLSRLLLPGLLHNGGANGGCRGSRLGWAGRTLRTSYPKDVVIDGFHDTQMAFRLCIQTPFWGNAAKVRRHLHQTRLSFFGVLALKSIPPKQKLNRFSFCSPKNCCPKQGTGPKLSRLVSTKTSFDFVPLWGSEIFLSFQRFFKGKDDDSASS